MKIIDKTNHKTYNEAVYVKNMDGAHEYPNVNLVRLERWFLKKPGKILDYGCGYGQNSMFLAKKKYKVTATEISPKLIRWLKKKFKKKNLEFKLISKSGTKLPYKNNHFDHIVCLGVLNLFGTREKSKYMINEFLRCLKDRGKLIISLLARQNFFVKQGTFLNKDHYLFNDKERLHKNKRKYKLYIPDVPGLKKLFNTKNFSHFEIGSWDNNYCGVKGKHNVVIIQKKIQS